ncbi:LPXTG cell wall anchor domain-containing protein [Terrisporobacter glycolicus]|uniref:Gram-positive cocci surface proteins LPxTG domain-containing protein n=1 Tax=Terrisporobacter glycolicus ATCC 14880 = DSM 1288 TaxID=1121315 RepID=A0ABZ2EXX1_9FIRM|nr:LPXTG cell wall anchor domain-containing protein [Terrisporobacter glycolicus]
MKKLLAVLLVCFSILLVGCVNTDLTLDIDKKGNMTMAMKLLINNYMAENMTEEDLQKVKEEYKADSIEKINEANQSGYLLKKDLGNIKDLMASGNKDIKDNKFINISEEKSLIYNTYDVTLNIKEALLGEMTEEDLSMLSFIGNSASMNLHMTTPFKLSESNATSTIEEKDGRTTYSWDYTLNTLDSIHVKFNVPNFSNIIMIIGGITVIVIGGFVFVRKRKNKEI